MTFTGFTQKDFDVFTVDGLDERMGALKEIVRPKLHVLGENIAPVLAQLTGEDMYIHVAKHARRTVNPPDDTWVAWANNKRGYKQHPHFQVGLWQTHLFIWFALIYESPNKVDFARNALPEVTSIKANIPDSYVWSVDHTKPDVIPNKETSAKELTAMLERLHKVKKSELLCGVHIANHEKILQDGQALQDHIQNVFETLIPLYRLAQSR